MAEDGGGGGGRGGWSRGVRRGNTFEVAEYGGGGGWSRGARRGNTFEVAQEDRGVSLFRVKVFMICWLY